MDCWRAFGQRRRSSLVHQTSLLTGKTPTTTAVNQTPRLIIMRFYSSPIICWYKFQQFNLELIIGILVIVFMHCIHHCSVCDRWIASQHLKQPLIKPSDWLSVRTANIFLRRTKTAIRLLNSNRMYLKFCLYKNNRDHGEVGALMPVYMVVLHKLGETWDVKFRIM